MEIAFDNSQDDRKIFKGVIVTSAIVFVISFICILFLLKNTQSVEAEVIAYRPQFKYDFIMSDTYNNKDCILSYNFNNVDTTVKLPITKKTYECW